MGSPLRLHPRAFKLENSPGAIAIDSADDVYVTGYSESVIGQGLDYLTMKLNPNGGAAWTRRFTSAGNIDDKAVAMIVDANGDICVTGSSPAPGQGLDIVTVKYSSGGEIIW
jgi:hypothetical protein